MPQKMIPVKCEQCHENSQSLFIVSHKEKGRIRICEICLRQESKDLQAGKSCSCC